MTSRYIREIQAALAAAVFACRTPDRGQRHSRPRRVEASSSSPMVSSSGGIVAA